MSEIELKVIEVAEEYQVIGNGVFAVCEKLGIKRELSGGEIIEFLDHKIKDLEKSIEDCERKIGYDKEELAKSLTLKNDVLSIYKKVPKRDAFGITLKDENGLYVYEYVKKGE